MILSRLGPILAILLLTACGSDIDSGVDGGGNNSDAAQPDAGSNPGTWNLTGVINGIDLQTDVRSVIAWKWDSGTSIKTRIILSNLEDFCSLLTQDGSCPGRGMNHREMEISILGTAPGSYTVTQGSQLTPGAGEVGVFIHALGDECQLLDSVLNAESGTVTFDEANLTPGGNTQLSFNITTAEGPISGAITAPFCDL